MKAIQQTGTKGLLLYLRAAFPMVYKRFSSEISQSGSLAGFGAIDPVAAASQAPPSSSLADTIRQIADSVASGYLTVKQQQAQSKILNTQLQRAKIGLPPLPIDPVTYGLPAPPASSSLPSLPPAIANLPWGTIGLAFVALLGFALLRQGRRGS